MSVSPASPAPLAMRLGNFGLHRALQAKLTVSQPADPFEQEADRVADQVMRMPADTAGSARATDPLVQRACNCAQDELQRAPQSVSTKAGTYNAVAYDAEWVPSDAGPLGYGAEIQLEFAANDTVDADGIAFVQIATSVKDDHPHNKYTRNAADEKVANDRMLPSGAHLDRPPAATMPLYGTTTDRATELSLGDARAIPAQTSIGWHFVDDMGNRQSQNATLHDDPDLTSGDAYTPATSVLNREWHQYFETAAFALSGRQKGRFYGSVEWGWSKSARDATPQLRALKANEQPSAQFAAAVKLWNASTSTTGTDTVDLPVPERAPAPAKQPGKVRRKPAKLARHAATPAVPDIDAQLESSIGALSGRGQPLPDTVRSFMEPRFGADFSAVRVHTDAHAQSLASAVSAKAFTVGNDVVFGAGYFSPNTDGGRHLLAHELTHVVQQSGTGSMQLSREPETWYRGEGTGVAQSKPGGSLHDLGDGLYLSDDAAVAQQYADIRAGALEGSQPRVTSATFEHSLLGRVLDLTKDPRWRAFLDERIGPLPSNGELIRRVNENYGRMFEVFLHRHGLKLEDYDAIIGEEFVRGGRQICIRNPAIAATMREMLKPYVPAPAGGEPVAQPEGSTTVSVTSTVTVTKSATTPDGKVVSEVAVEFSEGIDAINKAAPESAHIPKTIRIRLTQNADGSFVSAEPLAGESPSLVEALGRQIAAESAVAAEGAGMAGGASGSTAASGTVDGVRFPKVLRTLKTGVKWGGTALFVIVTGYQLVTASPKDRPRVLVKAAGGLGGGIIAGLVICNALLDLETAGWGMFICQGLAGIAGGIAGSEGAGEVYDALHPPPGLSEMEHAFFDMQLQPANVQALFYTMIRQHGADGVPMTPDFVQQFISIVPHDLDSTELYQLASELQAVSGYESLPSIIETLAHAVDSLPGRKRATRRLPPLLDLGDVLESNPSLRFRAGAPASGAIRLFPDARLPSGTLSDSDRRDVVPVLEIRIPHT